MISPVLGKVVAITDRDTLIGIITNPMIDRNKMRVLYVSDPEGDTDFIRANGLIFADPFVPMYDTLEFLINGNEQEFTNMYIASLESEEAQLFFTTIVTAIYKGIDILLYFPLDVLDLKYPYLLFGHLISKYGITGEWDGTMANVNPQFRNYHAEIMYLNNCITPQEYLYLTEMITTIPLVKIVQDLGLPDADKVARPDYNPEKLVKFLSMYHNAIRRTGNTNMAIPFIVEEELSC